ncbi:inositol monophosphatase family protein [Corynebacterium frankenforstense]|uniref:inositol monophosphatase family protein n=1 Tax=Corynebacterium frankenforstense TaxID=1230998 RepID=UPI0026ED2B02|nr:inositol monophosphatase family protein [Corynebacterium frankenforstense]
MTEPTELRDLAAEIAREAGVRVRTRRAELGDVRAYTMTKSSPVDPVTVVDTMSEEFIVGEIARLRPGDGVIGEEGSQVASHSGVSWVIDPIDGTVNFVYGLPAFAVSVAAAVDGEVVAGAVYDPSADALYSAARGAGATRTDPQGTETLAVSRETDPERSLVATGFAYASRARRRQAELLVDLLPRVRDIRRSGSAALDLCRLAEGRVDAYYEYGLSCWDFAAGAVIAEEAGAVVDAPALSVPSSEYRLLRAAAGPLDPALADLFDELAMPAQLAPLH